MSGRIDGSEARGDIAECSDGQIRAAESAPGEVPGQDSTPMRPATPNPPDVRPLFVRLTPWLVLIYITQYGLAAFYALQGYASVDGKLVLGEHPNFSVALLYGGAFLISCVLAFSFWSEKPWSRYFLVAFLAAQAMVLLPGETGSLVLLGWEAPRGVVGLALAGWYFFLKPNVRAYFRRLQSERAEQSVREPSIAG